MRKTRVTDQANSTNNPGSEDDQREEQNNSLILESIIPYQINRLSHRMNKLLEKDLNNHGLSISAWRVLAVLDNNAMVSVNDLAAYAIIEQSTLSRLLQRMETGGYINNRPSLDDRRVREIRLTPSGKEAYRQVEEITLKHVRRITNGLDPSQQKRLLGYIRHMRNNIADIEQL